MSNPLYCIVSVETASVSSDDQNHIPTAMALVQPNCTAPKIGTSYVCSSGTIDAHIRTKTMVTLGANTLSQVENPVSNDKSCHR